MREFQYIVNRYLMNRENQKKYLAVLLALSVLVSFVVPLILMQPADSMTRNNTVLSTQLAQGTEENHAKVPNAYGSAANSVNEVSYSPAEMSEVTLLIGKYTGTDGVNPLAWADGCTTAEQVAEAAKKEYFLGIAYDFCVFVENDFEATDSDAEGRVAVGGDITFKKGWNYQIGSGDYGKGQALIETDRYQNIHNFAHAIVNGSVTRVNTMSTVRGNKTRSGWHTVNSGDEYSYTAFYPPELDGFKRLVVGDFDNSVHYLDNKDVSYAVTCAHDFPGDCGSNCQHQYLGQVNEQAQFYQAELINFENYFTWLRSQSEELSKAEATGTVTFNGKDITLTAPEGTTASVIYFDIGEWTNPANINFVGIPANANVIINCSSSDVLINGNYGVNGGDRVNTYFDGVNIANDAPQGADKYEKNNHEYSERILYNFYNATKVTINANFNGTVFAPNARVESEESCKGHLSGALIAESFKGGLEFGYRPYRGPASIVGATSGYAIPLDKFSAIGNGTNRLANAEFTIYENDLNTPIDTFVIGEETGIIKLPSKVDFSGKTNYRGEGYPPADDEGNFAPYSLTSTYYIKETNAPQGYIIDETVYKVEITELIDRNQLYLNLTEGDGKNTFPQIVTTDIVVTRQAAGAEDEVINSWNIVTHDIFKDTGYTDRTITITENGDVDIFYMSVDSQNKTITMLNKADNSDPTATTACSEYTYIGTGTAWYTASTEVSSLSSVLVSEEKYVDKIGTMVFSDYASDENGELLTTDGEETYVTTSVSSSVMTTVLSSNVAALDSEGSTYFDDDGNLATLEATETSYSTVTEVVVESSYSDELVYSTSYYDAMESSTTECIGTVYLYESSGVTVPDLNSPTTLTTTVDVDGTAKEVPEFYYDPISMMVMPMPDLGRELKWSNKLGLTIAKVDDRGQSVSKATLTLTGEGFSTENWTWDSEKGIAELDLSKLTIGTVYKLEETETPSGYETAPTMYFKLTEDNKILYGTDGVDFPNELNLNNSQTLEMVDNTIYGAKLTLNKVNEIGNPLEGAQFRLYTADGELVYPYPTIENAADTFTVTIPEGGTEAVFDFYQMFKDEPSSRYNSEYVKLGYLLPGDYYLEEVVTPVVDDPNNEEDIVYKKPTEYFYFTIKDLGSGNFSAEVTDRSPQPVLSDDKRFLTLDETVLSRITQEMIDNDSVVLSVVFYSPSQQNYGSINYLGVVNGNPVDANKWEAPNAEYKTISYKVSDLKNALSANNFTDISQFQIQTGNSTTISSFEFLPVPKTDYTIAQIAWNYENAPTDLNVAKLTFYYSDKVSQTKENVAVTAGSWWHTLNLDGLAKDHVKGIKVTLTSSGDATDKFVIEAEGQAKIWGTSGEYSIIGAGEHSFGDVTEYVPDTEPDDSEIPVPSEPITTPTITASNENITIGNVPVGDYVEIKVVKNWKGDKGFESMRPATVEVQLRRSKDATRSDDDETVATQFLTADNNWTYEWTELQRRYEDENGVKQTYYYYVEETSTVTGYTKDDEISDPTSNGGQLFITNTLVTVNVPAVKKWETLSNEVSIPTSIEVQLQWKNGEKWEDVPGKTMVLAQAASGTTDLTGAFKGLPAGREYRIVEVSVPEGWTPVKSEDSWLSVQTNPAGGEVNGTMQIVNALDLGSLNLSKSWSNDNDNRDGTRPQKITVNVYRSTVQMQETNPEDNIASVVPKAPANVTEDYSRLLQYSLYFYDANMCGVTAEENSAYSWRADCHTGDEVDGGFHDAGDHPTFGLPQGYAASMIGWSFLEFRDSFEDLGQAGHYKTIMNQFCTYFKNSTKLDSNGNVMDFLYQKGDGDLDHDYWGPPEDQDQSSRKMYWTSQNGGSASDVAAEYAAALAINYLNFGNEEDLKYAKALYQFAVDNSGKSLVTNGPHSLYDEGGFYRSEGCGDDIAWAAGWLYKATGNGDYAGRMYSSDGIPNYWGFSWNDVTLAAAAVDAVNDNNTASWEKIADKVKEKVGGDLNSTDYFVQDGWGSARYNASMQMVALITAKHLGNTTMATNLRNWAKNQMAFLLGSNNVATTADNATTTHSSTCFVTGFADNSAMNAHHRAASGWTSLEDYKTHTYYNPNGSHTLIGALVGGPANVGEGGHNKGQMIDNGHTPLLKAHYYLDNLNDYCCNEVSLDYNAGLVGAAAGLFDAFGTGTLVYDASEIDDEIETAYPMANTAVTYSAVPTPKAALTTNFTLTPTATRKASAIKGISVVGSEKVAKATALYEDEHGKYFEATSGMLGPSDLIEMYKIVGYKFIASCNDSTHTFAGSFNGGSSSHRYVNTYYSVTATTMSGSWPPVVTYYAETEDWRETKTTCTEISSGIMRVYVEKEPTITITVKGEWKNVPRSVTKPSYNVKLRSSDWSVQIDVTLNEANNWTAEYEFPKNGKTFLLESPPSISSDWNENQAGERNDDAINGITDVDAIFTVTNTYTGSVEGDKLTITPANDHIDPGSKTKLTVTGNVGTVGWTITDGMGTVESGDDGYYFVSSGKSGTVTIEGSDPDGVSGSATVEVNRMTISTPTTYLPIGSTAEVTIETPGYQNVEWSAEPRDAVDFSVEKTSAAAGEKVTITAKKSYDAVKIIATDDAKNVAVFESIQIPSIAFEIDYSGDDTELDLSEEATITITTPGRSDVEWSVDPPDAVVFSAAETSGDKDTTLTITGKKPGEQVTITATDADGNKAQATIKINPMQLAVTSLALGFGKTAEIKFENHGYENVRWTSSDESVATVDGDKNGAVVTVVSKGSTTITATDDAGNTATVAVTVASPSISVGDIGTVQPGQTFEVSVLNEPLGTYTLTADGKTLSKNANGTYSVTASSKSPIELKLTYGTDYSTTVEVPVGSVYVEAHENRTQIEVTDTVQLYLRGGQGTYEWTSNKPEVASVDPVSGLVTANALSADGENTVVITATHKTDKTITASIEITVIPKPFDLSINQEGTTSAVIRMGDTATLLPNQTDKEITYEATPEGIVEIDGTTVTAVGYGTVTITATYGGTESKSVTLMVYKPNYLTGSAIMGPYTTQQLTLPEGVFPTGSNITWTTSNKDLLFVSQNGTVTSYGLPEDGTPQTATIYAVADDGTFAELDITVQYVAVKPTIPDVPAGSATEFKLIEDRLELTPDSWSATLQNLAKTDGKGNRYYYYIAEVDDNGNILTNLNGNGASYIPIDYSGNGLALNDSNNTISVDNYMNRTIEGQINMPSAGGEGTTWYYIAGAAIMLAGIAGYFVLKRKQSSER